MWNSVKWCNTPVSFFFKNGFRCAVFLPCSARGEFCMKPFLFCVLISAVHCPVLVQQTVPFGGLSSGAVWRKEKELIYSWVSKIWNFRGLPDVVKPNDLEHLEKPLHRIILPSTFHDNVSSTFEFLSLGLMILGCELSPKALSEVQILT